MTEGFARFAELAREIDQVRVQEIARTQGMREGVAEMTHHADQLEERLNGQRGGLVQLAKDLRLRTPDFTPSIPASDIDPPRSLTQIANAIDQADQAAGEAAGRGSSAGFLPSFSVLGRAALIYGIAALIVLLIQFPKWKDLLDGSPATPGPDFLTTMIVTPAIIFVVAWLVLRFAATSRMSAARERARTRMGFLLCFGVGPLGLLVAFALSLKQNLPK